MRCIVYDIIHVAEIHNKTIPSPNLLTNDTLHQLQTLASEHEFSLAYNASEPIRTFLPSPRTPFILQPNQPRTAPSLP